MIGRDPIGPMFYKRFKPGHVLYVSRRTYLRKVAVPDFVGITGEKTFVLETKDPNVLLQEFLPFVMSAEVFHAYAVSNSRGSVNPYLNWGELARYEFDLPPLDEQKRIADLLWAVETNRQAAATTLACLSVARTKWTDEEVYRLGTYVIPFEEVWACSPESGWSARPVDEHTGRYVLSLAALGPEGYRRGNLKNVVDTSKTRGATLRPGDLLISRANTIDLVGRVGIFSEVRDDVSFPDTMMRLSLELHILPEFAAAVLSSTHGRKHMRRTAAGSATSMVKINRRSLSRFQFPAPPLNRQRKVLDELEKFKLAAGSAEDEIASLDSLKTTLLSKIFGE